MSTRYNDGSHYENHQKERELRDLAAHAHRSAGEHGQEDHLTSHELTAHEASRPHADREAAAELKSFGHHEIAALAHRYWMERGCPEGSPDEDWLRAVRDLRSQFLSLHHV